MEQSPRLSLSYVMPQQAQKHVTVNESFRRLDILVQMNALSRSISAEPSSPAEGAAYILPAGKSGGAWSSFADRSIAAFQDGAWAEIAPREGFLAFVADEGVFYKYSSGAWSAFSAGAPEQAPKFGVNTAADATNRLSVKSNAELLSHDDVTPGTGDARKIINKSAAAKTASVVFQTGFSGRAEFGLMGDDHFRLKVSADGAAWKEAVFVDKATARVGLGTASPSERLHVSGGRLRVSDVNANMPQVIAEASDIGASAFFGWDNGSIAQMGTTSNHALRVLINGSERARFNTDGGVTIGSPTGGSKGAGTLNASAVYDDNALLSCYVFDQALDGAIPFDKWDAKAPTGEHAPARKFAGRIGGAHDPLTLDGYARHWREKRHLTSMPNERAFDPAKDKLATGEWIQRLVETVEIQAVLIETLNQRLKKLEGAQAAR